VPKHGTIIEPFAGSAAYACKHWDRDVVLVDRNPVIAGLWKWLTRVSSEEILALPLLTERGASVDALDIPQPAKWLIGFWCNKGHATPCRTITTTWGTKYPEQFWHKEMRARVAEQVARIRHWRVLDLSSYAEIPNELATWFVDPPYTGIRSSRRRGGGRIEHRPVGDRYPFGAKGIDYAHLGAWCRERFGQVIVCENLGATWLPFGPFRVVRGLGKISTEAVWTGGVA
jgi:hypothetical protein